MEGVVGLSIENIVSKCANDMRECDFWRLGQFTETDQKELEKQVAKNFKVNDSNCASFVEALKKMELKRP